MSEPKNIEEVPKWAIVNVLRLPVESQISIVAKLLQHLDREQRNQALSMSGVSDWRFVANENPVKEGVYQVFDFKGNIDFVVYGNSGFAGEPDGFFNGKKVKASEIIAFR